MNAAKRALVKAALNFLACRAYSILIKTRYAQELLLVWWPGYVARARSFAESFSSRKEQESYHSSFMF